MYLKTVIRKKEESGFTLVEVMASLVIISIILIGTFNLITFTNKVAVSNNDRLVAINLATATIERIKVDPLSYFNVPEDVNLKQTFSYDYCEPEHCNSLYSILLNDKEYRLTLYVNQSSEEKVMELVEVIVTIELPEENIRHKVEGYVSYGNG
ncbi:type IV pilus modification PilV family protein [Paucisalibacillus globulus]|uniref:type IV pilus modification PilV family protein n=1 Tax=Paucisalibacillus globulus TaxID=351095 RepID=UPI0004021B2A|nr:prepilin-type N-terminal cleavage/methylation domain-containing protein [Paucisalibacillus globulus]